MSDVQQQKREPQIIVGDLTNEELANWMGNKVHAIGCLSSAISNKESLERRLAEVNAEIERYSADAAIDVIRPASAEASSEAVEPKKGRVVELKVNGALLVSFNTKNAVAADYLGFIQAAAGAVSCPDSLEEEANRSGKTISYAQFGIFGSKHLSDPKAL